MAGSFRDFGAINQAAAGPPFGEAGQGFAWLIRRLRGSDFLQTEIETAVGSLVGAVLVLLLSDVDAELVVAELAK